MSLVEKEDKHMLAVWSRVTGLYTRVRNEMDGASLVEYALLVVLIAIVAIVAITFVGTKVSTAFDNIGTNLTP